jgi:hypothetical protein
MRRSQRYSLALCALFLTGLLTACPPMTERGKQAQREMFDNATFQPHQDQAFMAFLGRLRAAVRNRDTRMLASMMTPNFGFDLNSEFEGPAFAFQYWTQNNLWPQVEKALNEQFRLKENYVVSPPQFAFEPEEYTGPRAGILVHRNRYAFAYLVFDRSFPFQPSYDASRSAYNQYEQGDQRVPALYSGQRSGTLRELTQQRQASPGNNPAPQPSQGQQPQPQPQPQQPAAPSPGSAFRPATPLPE